MRIARQRAETAIDRVLIAAQRVRPTIQQHL
jgi:hypothetical protein